MANFQTNTNHTYYAILNIAELERTVDAITNNYTDLSYDVTLYNGIQNFSGYTIGYDVYIDGEQVAYQTNSGNQTSMPANSSKLVVSGTKRVYHNADGSKKDMSVSLRIFTNNMSYLPVELNASGTMNLTQIPRYATCNQYLANKTLNSIVINWSSDSTIDYVWYSKDNGSNWTAVGDVGSTSGSYTIPNLTPNTTYSIKTRVKRKDSQLVTESDVLSVTTYQIALLNNVPDFNHGDNETITYSNPSGSEISTLITNENDSQWITGDYRTVGGTSYTYDFTDTELDTIYKLYGNNNFVKVRIYLKTRCNGVDYWDSRLAIITLTGNQKTGRIGINSIPKRAKMYIGINGVPKKCVLFIGVDNKPKALI